MQCTKCGKIAQPNDKCKWVISCGCHDLAAVVTLADEACTEYEKFVASCIVDPTVLTHSKLISERAKLVKSIIQIASAI